MIRSIFLKHVKYGLMAVAGEQVFCVVDVICTDLCTVPDRHIRNANRTSLHGMRIYIEHSK